MPNRLKIRAPCKINLHLQIGDRRADGYHDIKSIFAALDFGDTLGFELFGPVGFCDIVTELPLPSAENIVYKAISLYRSRTGFNRGLRVHLEKRIPLGGGLGGGSSDAASALMALNTLAGDRLSPPELKALAEQLGSDVPFFLTGGTVWPLWTVAWVSGRGEAIEPLPVPGNPQGTLQSSLAVVLVNPGFPSGTAEAFRQLDLWREQGGAEMVPVTILDDALKRSLGGHPRDWPYENDFLPVFLAGKDAKAYGDIIARLKALGADFSGLSGAGATCFGVFTDGGIAEKAAKILSNEWKFVELTFFLARSAVTVLE
ncbi:4-diphosphocytidyl-2-C-methyl-D-erythritol kinase [Spirochaetia bacterium]|nr:4-diphosphocytidyl-2-C-methyl-D-erythritol kinase [Spirochaetia bacterium]